MEWLGCEQEIGGQLRLREGMLSPGPRQYRIHLMLKGGKRGWPTPTLCLDLSPHKALVELLTGSGAEGGLAGEWKRGSGTAETMALGRAITEGDTSHFRLHLVALLLCRPRAKKYRHVEYIFRIKKFETQ